VATLLPQSGD
jgi:hypothetical protein